ncbi:MAG: hypothetical protein WBV82_24310 [Myxococcaceae bacterium]
MKLVAMFHPVPMNARLAMLRSRDVAGRHRRVGNVRWEWSPFSALMGVLKANGIHAALDPFYPSPRL